MKIDAQPSALISVQRLEQVAVFSLVAGVILVFQWSLAVLYPVGLLLLAIAAASSLASQVMQGQPAARVVERLTVIGMIVGIVGMLQPWQILLYENGFYLLLVSTLSFIVVSHIGSPDVNAQ